MPELPLSRVEETLMICAFEATGLLAHMTDADGDPGDLAHVVLQLVDRGWMSLHRLEPWTSPAGKTGLTYGSAIPREELSALLADPATWDEPDDWVGAIAPGLTEDGKKALCSG